ncbi:hypothetical protein C922_05265 [Plasmodium inui San Antonio 1]|uniref:Uncharacterized protein n=1 Tax=Plasmodium inui San Antonio 1 TaxID=1237626 RepID=W7AGA5_9APIC|nr:hypothetical protein C922_05265 [Plasmodium inui San Antonio 1]EUD64346.1 hypothetical protein C922_05265 [Plasmodium inui San Antonio 1]
MTVERKWLVLKDASWKNKYAPAGSGDCDPDNNLYCIRQYQGGGGARQGFLGRIGQAMDTARKRLPWSQLMHRNSPLKGYILGASSEEYDWKGLLSCVVSKAVGIDKIEVEIGSSVEEVWKEDNWSEILNNGTSKNWSSSAAGQGVFAAVACIVAALMVQPTNKELHRAPLKQLCEEVWKPAAIELKEKESEDKDLEIKGLEQLLTKVEEIGTTGASKYTGLGFLLSIYYGLSRCCSYGRSYELTGLVRRGTYDLGSMGACHLRDGTFSCSGGDGGTTKDRLNIWTKGKGSLVGVERRKKKTLIVIPKGGEAGDKRQLEQIKDREREAIQRAKELMDAMDRKDTNTGIVAVSGKVQHLTSQSIQTPSNRTTQPSSSGQSPPVTKPQTQGTLKTPPPKEDEESQEEGLEERASSVHIHHENRGQDRNPIDSLKPADQLPTRAHDLDETQARKDQEPSPWKTGLTPPPLQQPGQASPGGIVGGVLAGLLAMGGLYGMYRVFRRGAGGGRSSVSRNPGDRTGIAYTRSCLNH